MGKQLRRANKKIKSDSITKFWCGGVAMNLGFYQEYDKRKHKDLSKYKMDFWSQ